MLERGDNRRPSGTSSPITTRSCWNSHDSSIPPVAVLSRRAAVGRVVTGCGVCLSGRYSRTTAVSTAVRDEPRIQRPPAGRRTCPETAWKSTLAAVTRTGNPPSTASNGSVVRRRLDRPRYLTGGTVRPSRSGDRKQFLSVTSSSSSRYCRNAYARSRSF